MAREPRVGMGLLDRLVLFLAWIATCGLVYLLGFYVGKGMQERRLGLEERIVRLPVSSQPPAEGHRQNNENEFGFYDKLMGEPGPAHAPAPAVAPPARVATAPTAPPPARPAPAPVGPPAPAPAVARPPPPPPPAPLPPAARPAPLPPPAHAVQPADVAEKVAPLPAAPAVPPHAAAAGGWTVLANPTRSREEADGLLRQLRSRGYDATLVRVVRDGDTWYRVQVGRFATSDQAAEVMRRLREREGVSHAFVASE